MENRKPKKISVQMREKMISRHMSRKTIGTYIRWCGDFVRFCGNRPPGGLGAADVSRFLNHLANKKRVAASTHRQALCAIVFMYKHVIGRDPGEFEGLDRPKRQKNMPTVLSRPEMLELLARLRGRYRIAGALLYGSGLRINECLNLRVKDVDLIQGLVTVRRGKGGKDRCVPLASFIKEELSEHLEITKRLHMRAMQEGFGGVELPENLIRKFPTADKQWIWQYVFPADGPSRCPKTGAYRRHHIFDSTVRKAIRQAANEAGIHKRVTPHTLRHSFATHMILDGVDVRTLQELMGHKSLNTTMIYLHVATSIRGVKSPLDNGSITSPLKRLSGLGVQDVDTGEIKPQPIAVPREYADAR